MNILITRCNCRDDEDGDDGYEGYPGYDYEDWQACAFYNYNKIVFGFASDSDWQTHQKYELIIETRQGCLMMDGDEGYEVYEEDNDSEDYSSPSKTSLMFLMMTSFILVTDDDSEW